MTLFLLEADKMNTDGIYTLEGTVTELLPNTMFRLVKTNRKSLLTTLKGKIKKT